MYINFVKCCDILMLNAEWYTSDVINLKVSLVIWLNKNCKNLNLIFLTDDYRIQWLYQWFRFISLQSQLLLWKQKLKCSKAFVSNRGTPDTEKSPAELKLCNCLSLS